MRLRLIRSFVTSVTNYLNTCTPTASIDVILSEAVW